MPRISNIPSPCSLAFAGRQQSVPSFNNDMKIFAVRTFPLGIRGLNQRRGSEPNDNFRPGAGYPDGRLWSRSLGNFNFGSYLTQAMAQLSVLGRSLRTNKTNERPFAARDPIYELDSGDWDTPVKL
jgi:hypothetical protein